MTADDIITTARTALGVPFRHQGRSFRGMDCVGLLCYICDRHGVEYIDVEGYPRVPGRGLLESAFDAHVNSGALLRKEIGAMRAGDFLMMRFGREPQHLAVLVGDTIIHSYAAVGKVCEHRLDERWKSRVIRVYRLAEIEQ
jgi:cell wall-associated NlpC family hydrolase